MLKVLDYAELACCRQLCDSMLRDRATQFVDRHQWDLPLAAGGREMDEFDAPGTIYCILEEGMTHLASVRLRAAQDGSMVERHFRPLWATFGPELREEWEVSRLLLSPARVGRDAIGDLLIGLCGLCLGRNIPSFFGVIFLSVARTLTWAGWPPRILGRLERGGETLLLARWEATHLVHWSLQERQEFKLKRAAEVAQSLAA